MRVLSLEPASLKLAYAYDQKVKPAGEGVELAAILFQALLRHGAVRNMDVLRKDIYLVEKGLVQPAVAALEFIFGRRVVLVYGDNLHVLERYLAGRVAAGELIVE